MQTQVTVIGGGVVGCATADALSRAGVSVLLLEKGDDVAVGASRANSGIVHAGYDCKPGTLKARFNVRGNELMWKLADELGVPHAKCGSLVAAPEGAEDGLRELASKAELNGVRARILSRAESLAVEPRLASCVSSCLYAPDAGVISPYKLTIRLAERAVLNGARVVTEAEVRGIAHDGENFVLTTSKGEFKSLFVINAAGAGAEAVNAAAGAESFGTEFRRGDYFVLDKLEGENVSAVIFPLPTAAGKGILVAPTADGNVIYGPTSVPEDAPDTAVTAEALAEIRRSVPLTYDRPAFGRSIRVYAGVRSIVGEDFIVRESDKVKGFFYAAGICSPGLTAAPAIAEYLAGLVLPRLTPAPHEPVIVLPHAHRAAARPSSHRDVRRGDQRARRRRSRLGQDSLPLREGHRSGDSRRRAFSRSRAHRGRGQEAGARGHGQVPGRILYAARDGDHRPRDGRPVLRRQKGRRGVGDSGRRREGD